MPIVLCKYCDYIGTGEDPDDQWLDVRRHELKEHSKEESEGGRPEVKSDVD